MDEKSQMRFTVLCDHTYERYLFAERVVNEFEKEYGILLFGGPKLF